MNLEAIVEGPLRNGWKNWEICRRQILTEPDCGKSCLFAMVRSALCALLSAAVLLAGCRKIEKFDLGSYKDPCVRMVDVSAGGTLTVCGRVAPQHGGVESCAYAAILMLHYYDASGAEVKDRTSPYSSVCKSSYRYLPVGQFDLKLAVPEHAVRADLCFARWTEMIKCGLSMCGLRVSAARTAPRRPWRMQIVSVWFLMFVAAVAVLYFCMPGTLKPWLLLLGSIGFYSCFNRFAFFFIGGSALSVWLGGFLVGSRNPSVRRMVLTSVLVLNIGMLLAVKYLGWAADGVCAWFDWESPVISIVLPLGVSFYTLQAVSYMVDVHRGVVRPERNFFKMFLYLIFFPTVMQGPISRYGQLGPQLWAPHAFSWDRMQSGLELALWGFFKKMVIADRVALLVDTVFAPGATAEGFPVLLGVIGYSIQIYADFSGCVDICRGISEMLGIGLVQNFKHPYFATSIKDFWRRWHISLSSWLKDYVYIPLGGNRLGTFRKYLNILIVFGVSGIWHGVGINFFIWGLLHGIYQLFDGLTAKFRERALAFCHVDIGTFSFRLGQRIATFALVTFAWIFFRAPTLNDAISVLKRLCVFNPWTWTNGSYLKHGLDAKDLDVLVFSLAVLAVVSILQERGSVRRMLAQQTLWFRWTIYLLGIFSTLIFGIYGPGYNASQFIYMQF